MKIEIEKRLMLTAYESYFIFSHGDKRYEIETSAAKSILLMWVFFATVFLTYAIGVYTAQENVKMTAYLLQGNLTDEKGQPVSCNPVMNEKKSIEWNCNITEMEVQHVS